MKNEYHVIGLMSGTSLDGLDIAYCKFKMVSPHWEYQLLMAETIEFPEQLYNKLKNSTTISGLELTQLDYDFGAWMGEETQRFIQDKNIDIDLISSHGHTVFHQPENGITLQIGSLNAIYQKTGLPVVGDFRTLDVALKGQGAPLVPIGDMHLFRDFEFCLNLGGMSNISFDKDHKRLAFDICPVNTVLNYLANKKGLPYDRSGEMASNGVVDLSLLDTLNNIEYYQSFGPKSLGIEWVKITIFPLLEQSSCSIEDLLCTYSHHIAEQIKNTIAHFKPSKSLPSILITGGGAFNTFLINTIKASLDKKAVCEIPSKDIVSFKEALIFAFIGLLKFRNEVNVLASVTGASKDTASGIVVGGNIN